MSKEEGLLFFSENIVLDKTFVVVKNISGSEKGVSGSWQTKCLIFFFFF